MKLGIIGVFVLLSLPAAWAADSIKPLDVKAGLWEATSKTETTGLPNMGAMPQIPEETLAKLPPAQRAQIEARMKAAGGPHTNTQKSCITQEMIDRGLNSFMQNENSCTYKVISSSSSKQELHTECSRGQMKMSGDVTIERLDDKHVKGGINMKSVDGPMPINMKMSFDSKWLSSDCGDVKPAPMK